MSDGLFSYCKPCHAAYNRNKLYGLTEEEFRAMHTAQDGKCSICQEPLDRPHVDHNHSTGKVRGLLCSPCNLSLGQAGDDLETILRAAIYLVRSER